MYNEEVTANLLNILDTRDYESFLSTLSPYADNEIIGEPVSNILEEWRKLQLAKKNEIMNDEQVHLAISAYFRKKSREITALLLEAEEEKTSGDLDS